MTVMRAAKTSLRVALTGCLVLATVGCDALQPPPTPHPALVALATVRTPLAGSSIELIDPVRLEGVPIRREEAIRRATAKMDPASAGGPTVSWAAQVATKTGPRLAWVVMRGDPRDPNLSGTDFALELAVIDAITGEGITSIVQLAP